MEKKKCSGSLQMTQAHILCNSTQLINIGL